MVRVPGDVQLRFFLHDGTEDGVEVLGRRVRLPLQIPQLDYEFFRIICQQKITI